MRISDWSSDVCSSDLGYKAPGSLPDKAEKKPAEPAFFRCFRASSRIGRTGLEPVYEQVQTQPYHVNEVPVPGGAFESSEERRVGKGWARTWRSRWWAAHEKKNNTI